MTRNVISVSLETIDGLGAQMVPRLKKMVQTHDETIYIMRTDKDLFVSLIQPSKDGTGLESIFVHGHKGGSGSMDDLGIEEINGHLFEILLYAETAPDGSIFLNFNQTVKTESGRMIVADSETEFLTVYPKAMGMMQ
jgi:hypothetical protein